MNRTDYNKHIDAVFQEILRLSIDKGGDYSGDEDVLTFFKERGAKLGLRPDQVLGVFLDKHLSAIETYIKNGEVKSEDIHGRIYDAINYLIHLDIMITENWQAYQRKVGLASHIENCILGEHEGMCATVGGRKN